MVSIEFHEACICTKPMLPHTPLFMKFEMFLTSLCFRMLRLSWGCLPIKITFLVPSRVVMKFEHSEISGF